MHSALKTSLLLLLLGVVSAVEDGGARGFRAGAVETQAEGTAEGKQQNLRSLSHGLSLIHI